MRGRWRESVGRSSGRLGPGAAGRIAVVEVSRRRLREREKARERERERERDDGEKRMSRRL